MDSAHSMNRLPESVNGVPKSVHGLAESVNGLLESVNGLRDRNRFRLEDSEWTPGIHSRTPALSA